jgi:ATP-dependent Clp protease, protease subunit
LHNQKSILKFAKQITFKETYMQLNKQEFRKFAVHHQGISGNTFDQYTNHIENMTRSVIEERPQNFREIDVFSRLIMDRIIFLGTGIDDHIANIIVAQLLFLESTDPKEDIKMYISSPGGNVMAGMGLYSTMQLISPDVSTVVTGMAASMASVLLSAGTKGKRYALPHSRIMIHQPSGGMQGQSSDMEISYKLIMSLKEELYTILANNTGKTYEQIEKDSDRDFWMKASEAVEYGIIDEILTRK